MYNRAVLVGRLTADPELRQTPNGTAVTSFTIAVNRSYSGKDSGQKADFLDVVAWRGTAEFICKYFTKGRAILVEGSIQTRSYTDKQGAKRNAWEILAENVHFVESKNAAQGGQVQPRQRGRADVEPPPDKTPAPAYSSGSVDDFAELDDDGDLPF